MSKYFTFQTRRHIQRVPVSDIMFMENVKRKVVIHTPYGVCDYYGKLSDAVSQLDSRFIFCHRSYLINLDHVLALKNQNIVFLNGFKIYLGRHSYDRLRKMLENQIFS